MWRLFEVIIWIRERRDGVQRAIDWMLPAAFCMMVMGILSVSVMHGQQEEATRDMAVASQERIIAAQTDISDLKKEQMTQRGIVASIQADMGEMKLQLATILHFIYLLIGTFLLKMAQDAFRSRRFAFEAVDPEECGTHVRRKADQNRREKL